MKALLDTHTFLWWVINSPNVSQQVYDIIKNKNNKLYFSAVSGWEIAIKAQLGRLQVPEKLELFISEQISINAFQTLPVLMSHALHIYKLPNLHRDPFDRMLVAQACVENLSILTSDPMIAQYKVKVIW